MKAGKAATPLAVLLGLVMTPVLRPQVDGYEAALAMVQGGRMADAVAALEKLAEGEPANARIWKLKGVAHAALGQMEFADHAFERACRLAPTLADACFYRLRSLYLLNRFEAALEWFGHVERDPRAERLRALCLDALGRWKEAEASYQRAVRLAASGEDARIDYGMALVRQGKAEEALPLLRAAARHGSQTARAHAELGRALLQLDRLPEARTALESAVALDGTNATARLALGRVLQRLGLQEEAAKHLTAGAAAAR
jgi:Flp pilus assembly protein TadD